MKRTVIITSIFPPTKAIKKFVDTGLPVIVVGDLKTPVDWSYKGAKFLSTEGQKKMGFRLSELLPYNHYCRKMMGYLFAMMSGAEEIFDTDDDNFPKPDWDFPAFKGSYETISENKGFVNIFQYFTKDKIWPRGFPLNHIMDAKMPESEIVKLNVNVGIWQGLIDEDPDVDSIFRLTMGEPCIFQQRSPLVLEKNTICPFNTQNTLFCRKLFPLLYLPSEVTFRFTDILRGLVAQPIMWLYEYHLGFTAPSVIQKRNPHDLMKDFKAEIPMFLYAESIPEIVATNTSKSKTITDNLYNAYVALNRKEIVTLNELKILNTWLRDIEKFI
jgi:hypothetical protein